MIAVIEKKIVLRYDLTAGDAVRHTPSMMVPGTAEDHQKAMSALHGLSICILVMKNGYIVIGQSAPTSAENFSAELGRKLAYEDAVLQLSAFDGPGSEPG